MNDKSKYWIELVEYDIDTAKAMLNTKRFLYVGFMCHQCVEKVLKSVIANRDELPPKSHNLTKLADIGNVYDLMTDEQKDLLDTLDPLNISARYPEQKEKLLSTLNETVCNDLIVKTEELIEWIKQQL